METRANFVLIGAFTIAGILGLLGFLIWLAKFQVDRKYDYYDILFSDVSGLSQAADVRFNGLAVGRVVAMRLSEEDHSRVRVRIEVEDGVPVKANTVARLQVQGVTGTSFVSLSGGSPGAPPPPEGSGGRPTLMAERSIVEQLTEDAPDLLTEGVRLMRDLQGFASAENKQYVSGILSNVNAASGQLQGALSDFSDISQTVSRATAQISGFTDQLQPVADALRKTLGQSEGLISSATLAFDDAQTTLKTATTTLNTANGTLTEADRLIREDVAVTLANLSGTVSDLRADLAKISGQAGGVLDAYGTTAQVATTRLTELAGTLKAIDEAMDLADTTLTDVDTAAVAFEELVEGDGAELVTESRRTLAKVDTALDSVNAVLGTDLPPLVADVRSAVATANRVVGEVGGDLTAVTGQFAPLSESAGTALAAATETLRNANRTLEGLDGLMQGANATIASAEITFDSLNEIIAEDGKPAAIEMRQAAQKVGTAVDQITADIPAAMGDLRGAISDASATMARINAILANSAGPVDAFAQNGLPEFTKFARELRELIARLDRIAGRIERDPARFFLGGQAPDYRR